MVCDIGVIGLVALGLDRVEDLEIIIGGLKPQLWEVRRKIVDVHAAAAGQLQDVACLRKKAFES